ncbi:RidA family protein [bacterium]|nr:RidA family protein [bacterium]
MKEVYVTDKAPRPVGPYSQVIKAGGFLFLAGQIPLTSENVMNEGDVVAQAHQVMKNLQAVLEKAGATLDHVVKTTIFLADLNDFEAVNEVYAQYFQEPYPARSTIQAARLPKGARLEIDAIAIL